MDALKTYKRAELCRIVSGCLAVCAILYAIFNMEFNNTITLMILFLVYVFLIYGGKNSKLLGVPLLLLLPILMIFDYLSFLRFNDALNIPIVMFTLVVISILRNRLNRLIKFLAVLVCIFMIIYTFISLPLYYFPELILSSLSFTLFILFCPLDHKRMKKEDRYAQIQKAIVKDLNSQLQDLKSEFENGRLTQEEYEYRRKSLIDKL